MEGQRAALGVLFDTHFDSVYRFCLARSGDPVTADDAAAEAFLAAARTFAGGRGHQVDGAWLMVTARRRLLDQWRSAHRHVRRIKRLTRAGRQHLWLDTDLNDPVDTDRVLRALSSLPERQRAALTLRYLDELSVAEVADALEVPYRAAESLLARGRRGFAVSWKAEIDNDE
jgi:RNA polymerase sigma-70 factor (ECF subfamily)